MLEKNDKVTQDLCSNPRRRESAIKLFNDIFRLQVENELYFFFPAGDILSLLSEEKGIGIKVYPALVNNRREDTLDITMVIKPLPYHEDDFKKQLFAQSDESSQGENYDFADFDEDIDNAKLSDRSVCCPTTGRPIILPTRAEKIKTWIENLTVLLENIEGKK